MSEFVSRAGQKLEHALRVFQIDVRERVCADFGSNVGGFVDCLLRHGAAKVYAVDTGYGVLEWKLRRDARVVVMERTNAMHLELPEKVDLVTIDVAWTRQRHILPAAKRVLRDHGEVVTLIKPHYEVDKSLLRQGVLPEGAVEGTLSEVRGHIVEAGFELIEMTPSPIRRMKGNIEVLAYLRGR